MIDTNVEILVFMSTFAVKVCQYYWWQKYEIFYVHLGQNNTEEESEWSHFPVVFTKIKKKKEDLFLYSS